MSFILGWIRRDKNQLADDLTNRVFTGFQPESRLRWGGDHCPSFLEDIPRRAGHGEVPRAPSEEGGPEGKDQA